jgi:hypothetical protein
MPNDDELLQVSYDQVRKIYQSLGASDSIAKGTVFVEEVKKLPFNK